MTTIYTAKDLINTDMLQRDQVIEHLHAELMAGLIEIHDRTTITLRDCMCDAITETQAEDALYEMLLNPNCPPSLGYNQLRDAVSKKVMAAVEEFYDDNVN